MGDILSGVFGGGERKEERVKPDPIAQALNDLRLQELQNLFGQFSFADMARTRPDIYKMSAMSKDLLERAVDPSNILSLEDFMSLGLDQTSNYISEIATPQILSAMNLQGLEGSGAVPEAIAKATAEAGLPFIQGLPQAANMFTNQANTLFTMSDFPRMLRQDDLLRQQGVLTTGLTGLPFTPGSSTLSATRQPSLFENFMGTGSATGSFFGGPTGFGAMTSGTRSSSVI
jgi:hypothetical protein